MIENLADSSNSSLRHRIMAVLPIPYGDEGGFWYRDMGLIVRTLRSMGYDAWLVALKAPSQIPGKDKPVIVATKEELEDPAWWKAQAPYGVIMNFWGATKWEGMREAARQATPRLVEKLDTAGIFSPRIWFWRYVYETASYTRDAGYNAIYASIQAFYRACVLTLMPGLLDRKRAACLARIPVVVAESPIAVERTKRYIRELGFPVPRVCCIPHPVDENDLRPTVEIVRANKIFSVGRWDSYQKNFPLLISVLCKFLQIYPDWQAEVAGNVPHHLIKHYVEKLPPDIKLRFNILGSIPHSEVAHAYRSARIYFMPSRREAFSVAASEALYSGCSVVTSIDVGGAQFITGGNCGTAACRMNQNQLLEALCAEAEAWIGGERDAASISANWMRIVGSRAVASKLVKALNEIQELNE